MEEDLKKELYFSFKNSWPWAQRKLKKVFKNPKGNIRFSKWESLEFRNKTFLISHSCFVFIRLFILVRIIISDISIIALLRRWNWLFVEIIRENSIKYLKYKSFSVNFIFKKVFLIIILTLIQLYIYSFKFEILIIVIYFYKWMS